MTRLFRSSNFASAFSASSSATSSCAGSLVTTSPSSKVTRGRQSAALRSAARAGVIDEHAAHDARGQCKEVRAVAQADRLRVDEPQVGLVDERGRLQTLPGPFAGHAAPRDLMELAVDERNQAIQTPPSHPAPKPAAVR